MRVVLHAHNTLEQVRELLTRTRQALEALNLPDYHLPAAVPEPDLEIDPEDAEDQEVDPAPESMLHLAPNLDRGESIQIQLADLPRTSSTPPALGAGRLGMIAARL